MKYFWRVWKWENGQKTKELTEYLSTPIYTEPHLDETLGTGEIILDPYPASERIAFPPKTKIRIERYLTKDFSDSPKIYDYMVDSDQVEEYVGCPEICCHRIELIDPSVVAQGMHVDNISLTRELNDNDLNYKTTISSTETVRLTKKEIIGNGYERPNLKFGASGRNGTGWYKTLGSGSYKFTNSFRYVWSNTASLDNVLLNLNGLNDNNIVSFTIPTLTCQFLNQTVPETLFECPIRTKVVRTTLMNNQKVSNSEEIIVDHFYNPVNIQNRNDYVMWNKNGKAGLKGEDKSLYLRNAPTENAYNLYNKAFLTTQNHFKIKGVPIDETPKAYYLEDTDKQELQNTIIVENFYNQKNWWELQLDIGKYIHAIPKVRFGKDDRFVTTWKKLGDPTQYLDVGNKITIYNSKNIEEYVDACSSYVSNMVQLGGVIDEWVAPKSSSSDYLVYNDVAEIITSMNIIELVDLEVKNVSCPFIESNDIRNLVGKGTRGEDPNGFIFEENIYNILSINANDSVNKGFALYYSLGTNKIQGLSYQLPSVNTGDNVQEYAVKRILGKVFSVDPAKWKDLKINDFIFHVVYRTKDSIRTNQTRPDLRKYLLASKYDRVPQHNQFNNQTDTVVDSVKFGNNTYGLLIRTGNTTYKVTEWVTSLFKLKQSGELYKIRDNLYYVSKVKNTYYSNHIISEVEFSKDFNRLSQIIGIPSEPRFYEISEQSQIKRDISLDEYIVVGTKPIEVDKTNSFIRQSGWEFISNLLLGNINHYPKYAVTKFKNDIDKSTIAGNETYNVEVCTALSSLSIQNTLTFSWKMKDNFSAGDQVVGTSLSVKDDDKTNTAYAQLKPFRYPDVYGRADLLDFSIIEDYEMTPEQVHNRPLNPIDTITNKLCLFSSEKEGEIIVPNSHGIALLKDNREMLSFNFNLQVISDSDRFVLSAYMWQNNKNNLKLALLNEEVNKISNETIPNRIITEQLFDIDKELLPNCAGIKINIEKTLKNVNLENISSIAIISTNEVNDYVNSGAKYFFIARNVSDLSIEEKKQDWYLGNVDTSYFKVK